MPSNTADVSDTFMRQNTYDGEFQCEKNQNTEYIQIHIEIIFS